MSSIPQVSDALKRVLTERAKDLERETGFVERSTAQLDGPTFVQTTVFGWMDMPEARGQLFPVTRCGCQSWGSGE